MPAFESSKNNYRVQLPVTPMIDIVFLLLIYFLLTTNFIVEEGISVIVPKAENGVPVALQELTITVDRTGAPYIGREKIPIENLLYRIKEIIGHRSDSQVIIRADKTVILDRAVRVMDIAKAAGAARLSLATQERP